MDSESAEGAGGVGERRRLECRAIKKYPATMEKNERWKKIAEEVPGKTKLDCVKRVKWIREEMLKKKK